MHRLTPPDGPLYVVRWINSGRGDAKHKYFRRHHDALCFLSKLTDLGKDTRLYVTNTDWQDTGS